MVSTTVYKGKEVTDKQGLSQNLKGVRTSLILATNPLKEDGGGEREWPHLTTRKAGAMATISLDDIKNETVDLVRTHLAVHFCIFFFPSSSKCSIIILLRFYQKHPVQPKPSTYIP
jgi:hypothetical protein